LVTKKTTPFTEADYKKEVSSELKDGRVLNAFLLIHSYIESYLTEWILISGEGGFSKEITDKISRKQISELILIHRIVGNINEQLYSRLIKISRFRNKITHELATIEIGDNKTVEDIKRKTEEGIDICGEIFKLYKKSIDERAKKIESEKNFFLL